MGYSEVSEGIGLLESEVRYATFWHALQLCINHHGKARVKSIALTSEAVASLRNTSKLNDKTKGQTMQISFQFYNELVKPEHRFSGASAYKTFNMDGSRNESHSLAGWLAFWCQFNA